MAEVNAEQSGHAPRGQLTREELYEQVWREPMVRVAERHSVSSSFLARVCAELNVPRPARGYWAKLEFGKAPAKPMLPAAEPTHKQVWNRTGEPDKVPMPLPKAPAKSRARPLPMSLDPLKRHPLLLGVKELFLKGRSDDDGLLKPDKRLLPDVVVSEAALDRGLEVANQLFQAFEAAGHRVSLASSDRRFGRADVDAREAPGSGYQSRHWSPQRPTVVYVGTVAIGLTLIELTEQIEVKYVNGKYVKLSELPQQKSRRYAGAGSWTTRKDFPSGRLRLQAYSPYALANWSCEWRETNDRQLPEQIAKIISALVKAASEVAKLVEEGERQAAIRRRQWEEESRRLAEQHERARRARAREDARKDLMQAIAAWGEVRRIQDFLAEAATESERLDPALRDQARARIAAAKALIGERHALDELLSWKAPDER